MRSEGREIHLALDIERDSVPLTGRVTGHGGDVRDFVGWTGLAAALTVLLEEAEHAGGEARD